MAIASGHGCSAPRPISSSSSIASSDTLARCGARNDRTQGSSAFWGAPGWVMAATSAGPPVGAARAGYRPAARGRDAPAAAQQRDGNVQCDDLVVAGVGYVQPPGSGGKGDARRRAELHPALAAHVAQDAVEIDGPHRAVVVVRDEDRQPAERVLDESQPRRAGEARLRGRTVVAAAPERARTGNGGDDVRGGAHSSHAVVVHV